MREIPRRALSDEELDEECGPVPEVDAPSLVRLDAEWLFGWRGDCVRPQDRCHSYLRVRGVTREGGDSAQVACVMDLCRRSRELGAADRARAVERAVGSALDVVEAVRAIG